MHTFPFIFIPLLSSNSSVLLLDEDSHPDSPHSRPYYPHSHTDSPHSHHSPHSIPQFPIPAFTDSRMHWLLHHIMIFITY